MKTSIALAVAALFAAAAGAQTPRITAPSPANGNAPPGTVMSEANVPVTEPDVTSFAAHAAGQNPREMPAPAFVQEPIASTNGGNGADADLLKSIADSLNAEPSLKNSKITVQGEADSGVVYLTGATLTPDQVKKATEIASAQAGEGKVVNAMLPDWHPTHELPNVAASTESASAESAEPATAESAPSQAS